MYYACLLYSAQETETKFYLLKGVVERQTVREKGEGGRGFSNKLPEQDCSPRVYPTPLDRSL
jgi:hypothetical protein